MKKSSLLFFLLFIVSFLPAQHVPIGGWQEHLSYRNGQSVAEGNGLVYCLTTSGIFSLKKSDNSLSRYSKVNGLSDVEGVVVRFNSHNGKFIIAYKNSNIDIIESGAIVNISDIKRKSIIGNKSINNIHIVNQYAYLACGFGIVVLDMDRNEIADTYYIGTLGASVNVLDITTDGTYLYAAAETGVYRALLSNPNLANYTSWSFINDMPTGLDLPTGIYNSITAFQGNIYVNFSKFQMTGTLYVDSLFVFDGTTWAHFIPPGFPLTGSSYTTYQIKTYLNTLVMVQEGATFLYDLTFASSGYYPNYFGDIARPTSALVDSDGMTWISDKKFGLVKGYGGANIGYYFPNGPNSEKVLNMSVEKSELWVAPGTYATYFVDGLYKLKEDTWYNVKNSNSAANMNGIYDYMNVLVDPNDKSHVYATTWGQGVLELRDGNPVALHDTLNSTIGGIEGYGSYRPIWTYGMAFDEGNNLWVVNPGRDNSLSVRNTSGTWTSINLAPAVGRLQMEHIVIDKNDQKWIVIQNGGGGILVYKGNTNATAVLNVNARKLNTAAGNGGLPSNLVYCLAKDNDDEIWVGTDKGVAVFYSPENVFNGSNFDAQQILLEQDGHVQILLETENVQAIAVDDANRKWIGTAKSGVFLMSEDGTKQIHHFDETNSPLFSNNVKSITIDRATGIVYFGTSKGIISYRGTSIEPFEGFEDVYAFPNPVHHGYDGPIAIRGLMSNTTLKITDISGTLVYETKSEGGQAIWNGKNFKDERVATGVYMVFCTSEDGTQKAVTKILLIN